MVAKGDIIIVTRHDSSITNSDSCKAPAGTKTAGGLSKRIRERSQTVDKFSLHGREPLGPGSSRLVRSLGLPHDRRTISSESNRKSRVAILGRAIRSILKK
jgi:hypothetical protein